MNNLIITIQMKKTVFIQLLFPFALALLFLACDQFKDSAPQSFTESDKSPVGSWKIVKVVRNSSNITPLMDFSKFRITFNEDGSYSVNNKLPFFVKKNGAWSLDDPLYPFWISFDEQGAAEKQAYPFVYYPVAGKRSMTLTFVPAGGCVRNVYSYTFEREESN